MKNELILTDSTFEEPVSIKASAKEIIIEDCDQTFTFDLPQVEKLHQFLSDFLAEQKPKTEKDLLIDFINYGKSIHLIPILHSDIEPLAVDFLAEKQFQSQKEQLIIDQLGEAEKGLIKK